MFINTMFSHMFIGSGEMSRPGGQSRRTAKCAPTSWVPC